MFYSPSLGHTANRKIFDAMACLSRRNVALSIGAVCISLFANAQTGAEAPVFDENDAELDQLVEDCRAMDGVGFIEGSQTICYNAAIFPAEFLALAELPPADQIIISSPGGNVATARIMSRILDERGEPVTIAGQCMSACAMVLVPGIDDLRIDNTAHISVHGMVMLSFPEWYGWQHNGEEPGQTDLMTAAMGYNFPYTLYRSGKDHMTAHLEGQSVDRGYIQTVHDRMYADAKAHGCRVDPDEYWGMIDAAHLQKYLGDRITHMERFIQSWDDPANNIYKDITTPIGSQTYIFDSDYTACE